MTRGDRRVHRDGVEHALRLLERNPYEFGSGLAKREAVRRLAREPLRSEHRVRIAAILRGVALGGRDVSLPGWRALAPLAERAALEAVVREGLASARGKVRDRAIAALLLARGRTHLADLFRGPPRQRVGDEARGRRQAELRALLDPYRRVARTDASPRRPIH